MKRRALALLCAGILAVGMLAGCGGSSDKQRQQRKDRRHEERGKK